MIVGDPQKCFDSSVLKKQIMNKALLGRKTSDLSCN